ncbi:phospholipase D family protein [Agrobacterium cavarae]|uniref:phospholipase D family protein n=1 Tax=Agrobacterium cavarae TaxID=2528239 RepID=UPI0028A730B4|nr:phospholipase D family protein [Agrobacterium cavarae]
MIFLNEYKALTKIREILEAADEATIVVAFWGKGAIDSLGLRKPWRSLKIVCNLESGACNPDEIEELLQLGSSVEVRSDLRLHGKVYSSGSGVVLGSSNASTSGLVVEGVAAHGWSEANIFSDDTDLNSEIQNWCNERFERAKPITQADIVAAQKLWKIRKEASDRTAASANDLIQAVRKKPKDFANSKIKVVRWARKATKEAEKAYNSAVRADHLLEGTDYYEGWGDDMKVDDWLIDYRIDRSEAVFTGYWKVLETQGELAIVRKEDAIALPAEGVLRLDEVHQKLIAEMIYASSKIMKSGKKEKVTDIGDFIKELDEWLLRSS